MSHRACTFVAGQHLRATAQSRAGLRGSLRSRLQDDGRIRTTRYLQTCWPLMIWHFCWCGCGGGVADRCGGGGAGDADRCCGGGGGDTDRCGGGGGGDAERWGGGGG